MILRRPVRLLFVLAACGALVAPAGAQSADDVLSSVRARLKAVDVISADFVQTFSSEYIDETESISGTILLKGDMYRLETPDQTFVTDGQVTWIYNRTENQVLINNYVVDETTFSLNRFLFDSEGRYYVSELIASEDGQYRLKLRAIDASAFFPEVTMMVRRKDLEITGLQVIDANKTIVSIGLTNVKMNPAVQSDAFTFEPPKTSQVVDLRS